MNYSYLIKKLREKMIVSQKELAEILNVSYTSVSRWENDHNNPTIKAKRKIVELCEKYNIREED